MSRRWTRTDLSRLRWLAAQGAQARDIAAALDRTVMAIRIKAAHLRIGLVEPETRRGPIAMRPPFGDLRRRG